MLEGEAAEGDPVHLARARQGQLGHEDDVPRLLIGGGVTCGLACRPPGLSRGVSGIPPCWGECGTPATPRPPRGRPIPRPELRPAGGAIPGPGPAWSGRRDEGRT